MALTKKQLKAMGIDEEKADLIMEGHIESIEVLQRKVAAYEEKDAKPDADAVKGSEPAQTKNSEGEPARNSGAVNAEIEALKQQIAEMKQAAKDKEIREQKTAACKSLLKENNISEDWIPYILKVFDLDAIKLNKDGTVSNKDDLSATIKTDWAKCIQTVTTKGAETATPPDGEEKKPEPNQAFIDKIAQHRAELYGTQPNNATEGG